MGYKLKSLLFLCLVVQIYAYGHHNETESGNSTNPYHNSTCYYNDCMCNECNRCTCLGGMWACTLMGCSSGSRWVDDGHYGYEQTCTWTQTKKLDMYGNTQCMCDCVFPPSAASGLKQAGGLFLVGMAVLGIILRQ